MVDALKDLLETPIEKGAEEVQKKFDELFGDLDRPSRMAIMLHLSVSYILRENSKTQVEEATKRGFKLGPGSIDALMLATVMDFTVAVKATIKAGLEAVQDQRAKKKGE